MKKLRNAALAAAVVGMLSVALFACVGGTVETGFRIDTGEMTLTVERGTEVDFSKLKVEAEFDDGTTKPLSEGKNGYSLDKGNYRKDAAGSYTITVRYKEYEAKTFPVTVTEPASPSQPTVTGIEVKTEPTKKEYFVGEDFDAAGLTVEKIFSDNTKVALTEAEYTVDSTAYDKTTVGTYTITVKLKSDTTKTDTFAVVVKAVPVTVIGIEVKTEPTKKEYFVGEDFDAAGLDVEKVMSDGTKVTLTEAEFIVDASAYDKTTVGTYTITVKLKSDETKTAAFTVAVKAAPVAYRIKTMPRTAFLAGEQFDAFGLEVEKTENGVTETLAADAYEIDFSEFDGTAAGRYEIRITPTVTAAAPKNARGANAAAGTTLKYTVSVSAVELDLANLKRHYREGEALDISGLAISYVDADGVKTPVPAEKYAVDKDSFYPWTNAGSSIESRIYIRLVDFPNFRLYYDYYVDSAPLTVDPVVDYAQSSTVVPYGYRYDPNGRERLSIVWSAMTSYGKDFGGGYDFGSGQNGDLLQVECDKNFDTSAPGVYTFTFRVRTGNGDPWRTVGPVAVTVLGEGAAYATRVSTEPFVRVKYGQAFDPASVEVNVETSDGQSAAKSLGGGDFVWTRRGDTVEYTLKNAYRTQENEQALRGQFQIERDTSEVAEPVFEGIELSGDAGRVLVTEQNGAFQATAYQIGYYEIRASYVNDPGYKLKIKTIGGAAPEDPYANRFEFTGAAVAIGFEIVESVDDGSGNITERVVKSGALTIVWGSEIQEASKLIEIEVAGQKRALEYRYDATNRQAYASARYVFEKADTAIPVRFLLKNPEKYALAFYNQTDRNGVSKFETVFYYEQAQNGKAVSFAVYSKETGAEALTGSIEFALRSQIVSIAYDGNAADEDGNFYIDFGKEAPSFSLAKLNVALNSGYTYRLVDQSENVIATDKQLESVLRTGAALILAVFDENGIEWERKNLYFNIGSSGKFAGYYLEADENAPSLDYVELYADGQPFHGFRDEFVTAERLRAIRWTVFYGAGEITDATVAYLDRDGNEIDLAAFDRLSAPITVRVGYTAYGMTREWNPDTMTEDVRFERTELSLSAAVPYTKLAELPNLYVEIFGLAPIPADANFMMDLSRFDIQIEVFRTTEVTASDFAARYKAEYRDEMTMTVEPDGTDRFLAKFFRSGALVTYLNVFITRDGVIDDRTQADVTYRVLTSDRVNFVRFTENEAYVTAERGAVLTVRALNRWAKVGLSTENPDAVYGVETGSGGYECIFQSVDNFNLTVTVTATDGVTKRDYLIHVSVRPERPLFEMRVGEATYTAFLSEMFQGTDGDFYTDPNSDMAFLTLPLKASALRAAYDAEAKTLNAVFTADGRFAPVAFDGEPGAFVESGAELTLPLFDPALLGMDMTLYPQYAGALCGGVLYYSMEGEQQVPIIIFVLPNA